MNQSIRTLVLATVALSILGCSKEVPAEDKRPPVQVAAKSDEKNDKGGAGKKHGTGEPGTKAEKPPTKPETEAAALTSLEPTTSTSVVEGSARATRPLPSRVTRTAEDEKLDPEPLDEDNPELDPESVRLVRFVLAGDVQDREPLEESEVFTTDTPKIFAFLHFDNAGGEPYRVKVHFERADGPALPYGVELDVGKGPRWRTWAYTRVRREPGRYRAVVRTPSGEDIASRSFEIVASE